MGSATFVETVNGKAITKHVSRTSKIERDGAGTKMGRRHFSRTFYAVTWRTAEGQRVRTFDTLAAAREEAAK